MVWRFTLIASFSFLEFSLAAERERHNAFLPKCEIPRPPDRTYSVGSQDCECYCNNIIRSSSSSSKESLVSPYPFPYVSGGLSETSNARLNVEVVCFDFCEADEVMIDGCGRTEGEENSVEKELEVVERRGDDTFLRLFRGQKVGVYGHGYGYGYGWGWGVQEHGEEQIDFEEVAFDDDGCFEKYDSFASRLRYTHIEDDVITTPASESAPGVGKGGG